MIELRIFTLFIHVMKKELLVCLIFFMFSHYNYAQLHIDWQNCFIGPDNDRVNDVLQLDDGFFVLGSYGIHVSNPLIIRQSDVWLIKTDLDGNFLWDKKFGGSKDDFGKRILRTSDNNYIIIAQSSSDDEDLSNNPYPGSANYWVYKINQSGEILWSKIVGGNGPDWPNNAVIRDNGNIMVVGQSQSNDGDLSVHYGSWDIWIVDLDAGGNLIWERTIGTEGIEWADEVVQNDFGEILIGGTSAHYGVGNIQCDFYNELYGESLLTKLDSNLNMVWQQCYGGSVNELICSISSFQEGYFINHSSDSFDGDLYNAGLHGGLDIWITKNDSLGNLLWGKCYGGSENEFGYRTFVSENGDVTVFGITESNDGDVHGIHSPSKDIWVFKIDSSGNLKWQQCLGGTGSEAVEIGVKKISNNSYVVAAVTLASFGSGDVGCNTNTSTANDLWFFQITDTTIVSRNEDSFSKIKIFPNPAEDYLILTSDEKINGYFTLYNAFGEKVIIDKFFENELYLDIQEIPAGVYISTIRDKQGNFTANKIIIN